MIVRDANWNTIALIDLNGTTQERNLYRCGRKADVNTCRLLVHECVQVMDIYDAVSINGWGKIPSAVKDALRRRKRPPPKLPRSLTHLCSPVPSASAVLGRPPPLFLDLLFRSPKELALGACGILQIN